MAKGSDRGFITGESMITTLIRRRSSLMVKWWRSVKVGKHYRQRRGRTGIKRQRNLQSRGSRDLIFLREQYYQVKRLTERRGFGKGCGDQI